MAKDKKKDTVRDDFENTDAGTIVEPVEGPAYDRITPTKVLTPEDQKIKALVDNAPKDAPRISDYIERRFLDPLSVEHITKGPEYGYAWLDINNLSADLYPGSKWVIVNGVNHSRVERKYFDTTGAITFRGANILAFCRKEHQDQEQQAIVDAFNEKTEAATKVTHESGSVAEPGRVTSVDPNSAQGAGSEPVLLDNNTKTDFDNTVEDLQTANL